MEAWSLTSLACLRALNSRWVWMDLVTGRWGSMLRPRGIVGDARSVARGGEARGVSGRSRDGVEARASAYQFQNQAHDLKLIPPTTIEPASRRRADGPVMLLCLCACRLRLLLVAAAEISANFKVG